ncbi:hypothetical protein F9K07_04705 [Hydrogenophaga sp. BPS33]|nr:hypothetical protein F9K07_04705 [Hydrogenophaga sp. BPS33]
MWGSLGLTTRAAVEHGGKDPPPGRPKADQPPRGAATRAAVERGGYLPSRYGSSKSMKSCSAMASSIHAFTPGNARTRST